MADGEGAPGPVLTLENGGGEAHDEALTAVEANYLRLIKADADRTLQVGLAQIIDAHGHKSDDGRHYNFIEERGQLLLRISQAG
jgi:hypothetical protein